MLPPYLLTGQVNFMSLVLNKKKKPAFYKIVCFEKQSWTKKALLLLIRLKEDLGSVVGISKKPSVIPISLFML